jgi:hypothetical protein
MFSIKTSKVPSKPGCWDETAVEIFEDSVKIGEYKRNYSCMYNTFVPFQRDGKWYALYSEDYTATRIMSLPDCKDLSGENSETFGFCPVDYYVPTLWDLNENAKSYKEKYNFPDDTLITGDMISRIRAEIEDEYQKYPSIIQSELASFDADVKKAGTFGFVSGCVWGDDSSWKIQYLDLTNLNDMKRDERFGYIEMGGDTLKDSVRVSYGRILLKTELSFKFDGHYNGYFNHDDIVEKSVQDDEE